MAEEDLVNVMKIPVLIMAAFGGVMAWASLILKSDLTLYTYIPLYIILVFLIGMRTVKKFGMELMMAGIVGSISSAAAAVTGAIIYWNLLPLSSGRSDFWGLMAVMLMDAGLGGMFFAVIGFVIGFAGGAVGRRSIEESEGRS